MPQPKKGAKRWSLNVRDVPVELWWYFHDASQSERQEFGKWVIESLKKAAREKLGRGPKEKAD